MSRAGTNPFIGGTYDMGSKLTRASPPNFDAERLYQRATATSSTPEHHDHHHGLSSK